MNKKVLIYVILLALFFSGSGCKEKELDPQTVAKRYFAAVEKGNATLAYQYLCDQSYVIIGTDGKEMRFMTRPDRSSYVALMNAAPRISIVSIEEQKQMSTPGKLVVFKIVASVKDQDRNVHNSASQFYAYIGPNSKNQWSVMLPDLQRNMILKELLDTSLISP